MEKSHDSLVGQHNVSFEFWLNVEAFEYLRDDPCLPVDPAASGMGEILNRATKARSPPSSSTSTCQHFFFCVPVSLVMLSKSKARSLHCLLQGLGPYS